MNITTTFLETIRLPYLAFFKPFALQERVEALNHYRKWRLKLRALIITITLAFVVDIVFGLLVVVSGRRFDWKLSIAYVAFGVAGGTVGGVGFGLSLGGVGDIVGGITGGFAGGLLAGGVAGAVGDISLGAEFTVVLGLGAGTVFGALSGVPRGVRAPVRRSAMIGIIVGILLGVVVSVMFDVVPGRRFSIVGHVIGALVGSIIGGVVFTAMGFLIGNVLGGLIVSVLLGVSSGVALSILRTVEEGISYGVLHTFAFLMGYFRLYSYPLELVAAMITFVLSRFFPSKAIAFLHYSPIYLDELIWLPLPFLDRHLLLITEQDREAGLEEIANVARSFRQGGAARSALLELAARDLEAAWSLPQMARIEPVLVWLPDDPGALPRGAHEALRRTREISQGVAAALESTSRYRRMVGLERARSRLDELGPSLAYADHGVANRLGLVAKRWGKVIDAELVQIVQEEVGLEIPQVYIAGPPVPGEEERLFVGREDLFRTLLDLLTSPRRPPALMLHGQRRTGKTSLLLQLPRRLDPDVIPIFVDMQRAANVEGPVGLLYNLARAIREEAKKGPRVELPPLTRQELAIEPFIVFDEWLDRVEKAFSDRLVLLSLDEFEKIEELIGRIGTGFLDFLRHLIQHRHRFVLLFSGSHILEEMGQRWSTYFINVQSLKVSYLKEADVRQLITNPIDDFPLNYEKGSVEHVTAVTRCQPFLVQLTCQALVDHLNNQRRRLARVEDVEIALREALVRGEFHFSEIGSTTDDAERAVLTAITQQGTATFEGLQERTRLEETLLHETLRRLCHRDLLELKDGRYCFQVELVRRWWRQRLTSM